MSHTIRRRKDHAAHVHAPKPARAVRAAKPQPVPVPPSDAEALVTDHAVLRWLERVTGIDVGRQVRAEILAEGRDRLIPKIGNGKLSIADSEAVLQIRAGRVVTVKRRSTPA